jgi:hypothetical protein
MTATQCSRGRTPSLTHNAFCPTVGIPCRNHSRLHGDQQALCNCSRRFANARLHEYYPRQVEHMASASLLNPPEMTDHGTVASQRPHPGRTARQDCADAAHEVRHRRSWRTSDRGHGSNAVGRFGMRPLGRDFRHCRVPAGDSIVRVGLEELVGIN